MDLEAAQTMFFMLVALFLAGAPGRMFLILRRCCAAAQALYEDMPPGIPPTVEEWVAKESLLRLRSALVSLDQGVVLSGGASQTFGSYYHPHDLELPCSDELFLHPHPETAFSRLFAEPPPPPIPVGTGDAGSTAAVTDALAAAPFRGGSIVTHFMFFNYLRHLDLVDRAAPDGPQRFAAATGAALLDRAVSSRLPFDLRDPARGIDPFAAVLHHARHFPSLGAAVGWLQSHAHCEDQVALVLAKSGFGNAAAERFLRVAACLRAMLAADPGSEFALNSTVPIAYRAGLMLVAKVRERMDAPPGESADEEWERLAGVAELAGALDVVARYLASTGNKYGVQARTLADEFAGTLAGMDLPRIEFSVRAVKGRADVEDEDTVLEDEEAEGKALYFPDSMVQDPRSSVLGRGALSDLGSRTSRSSDSRSSGLARR